MADHRDTTKPILRRWRPGYNGIQSQLRLMASAENHVMVRHKGCAPFVMSEREWLALDPITDDDARVVRNTSHD